MIALPSLRNVPPVVSQAAADPLAARCALALAAPGRLAPVRTGQKSLEHAALEREMTQRMDRAAAGLRIFRPAICVQLGAPALRGCCGTEGAPIIVWLRCRAPQTYVDSRWALEPRWDEIESHAPGLGRTALAVLDEAETHGVPVFTPAWALWLAQWTYWRGEENEKTLLEELRADGEDIESGEDLDDGQFITRAMLDKALPRTVTVVRRVLKDQALARLARRQGRVGKLARALLELRQAARYARRQGRVGKLARALLELRQAARYRVKFRGDRSTDGMDAIGFAAALRWNGRDPMLRIYDDYGQQLSEYGEYVEPDWIRFELKGPQDLPAFMDELERRFAVARIMEEIILLIGERLPS